MVNSKHAFWLALVFSIAVFAIGITLGFYLESMRADSAEVSVLNSEINLLDEQLRNDVIEGLNLECGAAVNSTFDFADKIYLEAQKLERYGTASSFANNLDILHKRYDILRAMLWLESIKLRERCKGSFHTVVYLYEYESEDLETRSEQAAFSRKLTDIKEAHGDSVLLIPIAANLNLDAVNLLAGRFSVKTYPSIVVDESSVIDDISGLGQLENVIFQSNK